MSTVTVQNFAEELKRPVTELLSQLKEAGVSAENAASPLSQSDKMALLAYLRQKTRPPPSLISEVSLRLSVMRFGAAGGRSARA
jgi:hypothetical protein